MENNNIILTIKYLCGCISKYPKALKKENFIKTYRAYCYNCELKHPKRIKIRSSDLYKSPSEQFYQINNHNPYDLFSKNDILDVKSLNLFPIRIANYFDELERREHLALAKVDYDNNGFVNKIHIIKESTFEKNIEQLRKKINPLLFSNIKKYRKTFIDVYFYTHYYDEVLSSTMFTERNYEYTDLDGEDSKLAFLLGLVYIYESLYFYKFYCPNISKEEHHYVIDRNILDYNKFYYLNKLAKYKGEKEPYDLQIV